MADKTQGSSMMSVQVSNDVKRRIEKQAASEHRTISGFLRSCIYPELERRERESKRNHQPKATAS